MRGSATGRSVAALVLGPADVALPVMAKVPPLAGQDEPARHEARKCMAVDATASDAWSPGSACLVVGGVVAAGLAPASSQLSLLTAR